MRVVSGAFNTLVTLLLCAAATAATAQTPTVITNPAIGVFVDGINLRARIDAASTSGVVITATRVSGVFPSAGTLRVCRGQGNYCETMIEAPYAAGASTVTFPSFTPRAIQQNFYYVQRVDATATSTGGLDSATRSGSMIVIVDNAAVGRENAAQVSVASGYACALTTTGVVKCWYGGDTPLALTGAPPSVTKVSVSSWSSTDFSCLLASGAVYCWGNSVGDGTTASRSTPVAISGIPGTVTDIFVGYNRACAITGTSVWCWRDYGYEVASGYQPSPAYPATLSPVAFAALGNSITDVSMTYAGACALNTTGDVLCWGTNLTGNLGNPNNANTLTLVPVGVVAGFKGKLLATNASPPGGHVCAVTYASELWCWGSNTYLQLGRLASATPLWQAAPATLLSQNVIAAVVGGDATCVVHPAGRASCWGDSARGRLGIGGVAEYEPTGNRTGVVATPSPVLLGDAIVSQLSMSNVKLCVVLADGSVRCAGPATNVNTTSIPSSTPFRVDGFGPIQLQLSAPTIIQATRARDIVSLKYQDNQAAGGGPITAHHWACYPQSNGNLGNAAEVATNEIPGSLHVLQGTLSTRVGPWQCKVRLRTFDGISAWSPFVAVTQNVTADPTVSSAIYDGSYGTVTWKDNSSDAAGPIISKLTYCTVQWRNAPTVQVAGCEPQNSRCYVDSSVSEPTNQTHVSRLPLPPATDFSSGTCRVIVYTFDGNFASVDVPITQAASPAPTIVAGRVVGTQAVLTFADNRADSAGTILSAVYACTRVRDGATSSNAIAINEPANAQHTITVPLLGNNLLQDPDSYSCKVRVTPSVGTVSPDSAAFAIGPNSPPVVSNFSFTSSNGVITGALDINDPEGDQVKNIIVYFGSTPRSMECSSGTLGASWDVPRGGGRVQFNASQTNVGCAALTASANTVYGFVTAQDVNGLHAAIVDAQSSNTPPAPIPVSTTTTYSIVFDAVPTTLAVKQAVDISMRIVDQNGVTATQFRGPVRVSLSVSGIGFSLEDPNNPAAVTQSHRVVWFLNGVGKIRALRIHDPAVVRLVAVAEINGTSQFGPVVASAPFGASAEGVTNISKAAIDPSAIGQCRGVSSVQIRVGSAGDATLVSAAVPWTISLPQTSATLNSQFFTDWKNGTVLAYLLDADNASLPPYGGVRPNASGKTVTINAPSGSYRLVFRTSAGVALKPVEDMSITTGAYGGGAFWAWERNLPIDSRRRKVLYLHGVFGSALQLSGTTEYVWKGGSAKLGNFGNIANMPPYACRRSTQQERTQGTWGTDNQKCGSLSVLLEDHFWGELRTKLEARGYEVVPVAWDWRLTPDQAQEEFLARAIEREATKSGQPVDIVAHSMGGTVSLAFLSSLASNSRLSGYVDRLVMVGTPVAGSVNAYGLMEAADPLGLSDSLARSVGKGPVRLSGDYVYSAIAGYLWDAHTGGRENLYYCSNRTTVIGPMGASASVCTDETYTRGITQDQRRAALTAQAPGGWFLYPNRQHLPFAATLPAPSSHLPPTATAFFQKSDSPNSFNTAALNAECRYDPTAATTLTASRKTNVNILLSRNVTTISTVGTKKSNLTGRVLSINETTVKDWSEIQRYDDEGDGTVLVRGQLEGLATFLGTSKANLLNDTNSTRNNPCATVGSFGEHGDLPLVASVHDWVLRRLPYPGVAVANAPHDEVAKATLLPVPKLVIATEGVVDIVVRDPALIAVGRTRLSTAPFEAASGQTSAVTRSDGNRVQISIDNPTVGSTSVQLTGTSQEKTTIQSFSALYADIAGQVSTASIKAMIRSGVTVDAWVAVQSTAASLPIEIYGPSAPTNIRSAPGATGTSISWLAPSSSVVPVVGYRVYASPSQDDGWSLIGTVGANASTYLAPYPAASNVRREISFVVVAVDAQDRLSRVPEFTSNRVIDHIESNFVSVRGTPGATVTSAAITLPNNVPVAVSVSGGQMSVNGGTWGTTPLVINPGDTVALRGVTPSTRGAQQDVVLTTGTSSTAFSVLGTPLPFCVRPTRPVADAGTFVRYLKLVTGLPLLQGLYPTAEVTTTNASILEAHYRDNTTAYDFNGDKATSALVDGVLYARYALGFRGAELVAGLAVGTARTTAQIEAALAACQ